GRARLLGLEEDAPLAHVEDPLPMCCDDVGPILRLQPDPRLPALVGEPLGAPDPEGVLDGWEDDDEIAALPELHLEGEVAASALLEAIPLQDQDVFSFDLAKLEVEPAVEGATVTGQRLP